MSCGNRSLPEYYISAYGLAVKHGFRGTEQEWEESLKVKGDAGKSAYETAVEGGYSGTEEQFADKLANQGKSAYDYAVEGGYTGTPEEFSKKLATEYTINGNPADPSGNWIITPEEIGAQPAGSYATKQEVTDQLAEGLSGKLDKTGGTVTGSLTVQEPSLDNQAATAGYAKKQGRWKHLQLRLPLGGWRGDTQTVAASGIHPGTSGICGPAGNSPENIDAYDDSRIYKSAQGEGQLTFRYREKPSRDVYIDVIFREVAE